MRNGLLAGLVVLLLILVWRDARRERERTGWEDRVDSALVVADSLAGVAGEAEQRAREAESEAQRLGAEAASTERRARQRVVEIRVVEVPESAVPYTAPRDSVIDSLRVVVDQLHKVIELERVAKSELRRALGTSESGRRLLDSVLNDRPGPEPWWKPAVGVGPFVGVCNTGVCTGLGFNLTWKVPLP